MKLKFLLLALTLSLAGCNEPDAEQVPAINKNILSNAGETVGALPDGRTVTRWAVWSPSGYVTHYIYVIEKTATITTNRTEMAGKVQVNRVDVVIVNGKEYVPAKK